MADGRYKVVTGFTLGAGRNGAMLSKWDPEVSQRPDLTFDLANDPKELNPVIGIVPTAAGPLLKALSSGSYPG